jgi:hypothetical protein
MFDDCSGRRVRTREDAECYLWKFMAENHLCEDRHIREHSHDFDLYLPWLLEILEYQKGERSEALPILQVQQLYMDAAWDLVMRGLLRPGPRTISGDSHKDGYGKGYSLTLLGCQRLSEETRSFTTSGNPLT